MASNLLFTIGLLLVLAGLVIGILAFLVAFLRSSRSSGQMRGGGVVMIGPIPIVFGTDKESTRTLMLLAILLMGLFLIFSLLPNLWR